MQLDLTGTALVALSLGLLTYGTTLGRHRRVGRPDLRPDRGRAAGAAAVRLGRVTSKASADAAEPVRQRDLHRQQPDDVHHLRRAERDAVPVRASAAGLAGYGPLVAGLAPLPLPLMSCCSPHGPARWPAGSGHGR